MSRDTLFKIHGVSPADAAFGNLPGDSSTFSVSYLPQSAAPASSGDFAYLGMLALALGLGAAVLLLRRPQK